MRALLCTFAIWIGVSTVGWAQSPLLVVENAQGDVGQPVEVNVVLKSAPQGLQQYVFVVEVADPAIATLTGVVGVKLGDTLFQLSSQSKTAAEFRALDLNNQVKPGDEDVVLAKLSLSTLQAGSTPITLRVKAFVDDNGVKVDPQVQNGVLTVGGGPPTPPPPSTPERTAPRALEAAAAPPRDLDGDGLFEDVNGDGQLSSDDAALLLNHLQDPQVQEDAAFFDFNGDGRLDNDDVSTLLDLIGRANPPPPRPQPASAPLIQVGSARVNLNEPVTVDITLVQAPEGLEKFALRLRLAPAGIARIAGVDSVALPADFVEVVSQTDEEVFFRGADFQQQIQPGAQNVVLGRLRLQGVAAGTVRLEVSVEVFTAEDSSALVPTVEGGQVTFFQGPAPLAPDFNPPRDLDGDGKYEDLNGDGVLDTRDALILAFNLHNPVVQNGAQFFDFNGDGRVTFADAVVLAGMV